MNKKNIIAVMSGALAAGLVCLITGLIVYFTANGNIISLITGLFTTAVGIIVSVAAAIVLIITVTIYLISKYKNKNK